jgi:hypothetical protein
MYRLDTSTKNSNAIANIKMGNSTHDVDFDGSNPNVMIQTFGGRSSTNHSTNTSPVTLRFQTTTYSTTATALETRWEMRSVNQDDGGANRGLHSGSFGNIQIISQSGRQGVASTVPTMGSRYIFAYAEDIGPVAAGTTNNITLTSTSLSDVRSGQVFEIFAECTAQGIGGGITTAVTVTADWVGAGTSAKTVATGSSGSFYGYMRCIYVNGADYGGTSGWYGIFGAEGVNSGEVNFTG